MKQEIQIADKPTLDRTKHGIWLLDYKTYGTDSYVYNNKNFLHELYSDYAISMNDNLLNSDALIYAENNNEYGKALLNIYGVEYDGDSDEIGSIDDLISNTSAMTAIANNSIAMKVIANSSTAMNAIATNSAAMNVIANSSIAMKAIVSNKSAMYTLYNYYNQAAVNIFFNSNYLLSACQSSSLYEVTSSTTAVLTSASTRRTHYSGKCLVLGMSQQWWDKDEYTSYVDTLNGTYNTSCRNTAGSNGLTWRINKFANGAKCQPFYSSTYSFESNGASYMAILKIV